MVVNIKRMILMTACATLIYGSSARYSVSIAQSEVFPQNINECTTLTDPAKLQQCILTNQGGRKMRGKFSSTPKSADAPIFLDSEHPGRTAPALSIAP